MKVIQVLQFRLHILAGVLLCGVPLTGGAQTGSLLKNYQDSLGFAENHLAATIDSIKHAQQLQARIALLRVDTDPFTLVAGVWQLDSLLGGNTGFASILLGSQKEFDKMSTLNAKNTQTRISLEKQDTSSAQGRKQYAKLQKQLLKDQDAFDALAAPLLLGIRSGLDENSVRREDEISRLKTEQGNAEKTITDLKWKIEMEVLNDRTTRLLFNPPPSTPMDLLKAYGDIIEAADRDRLHGYDSLFVAAQGLAATFLEGEMTRRHREAGVLIPQGAALLASGRSYTSRGYIVSRIPILQQDVVMHLVAAGERGLSFVRKLRSVIDRPVEKISTDTLVQVAGRFGGRLLTNDDREFVEASGFASVEERRQYGVLANFYEFPLNDRYAYVCWDTLQRDPSLVRVFAERQRTIEEQKNEFALEAWRMGVVWNPKRFIVSFGGLAAGYLIQHTEASTQNAIKATGAGLGSATVLLGYRYAIDGTEVDGERYGYIGLQASYVTFFGKVIKTFGSPAPDDVKWSTRGYEVMLVATLLRSFYLGAGIGHLQGDIEITRSRREGSASVTDVYTAKADDLPGYYVFPFGFVLRVGTNFSFNLGGAVRWKGAYTNPSLFFGLGFFVDIPIIRVGP